MDDLMKTTMLLIESEQIIADLKETNEQLDSALVKAYNDIESLGAQLDAHLERQLDMPNQEDIDDLEKENADLKSQVAKLVNIIQNNK